MDAVYALLRSRKFLLMLLDLVVSLVIWFTSNYDPAHLEQAKQLIALLQPVFVTVIGAIAYEDGKEKGAVLKLPGAG